MLAKRGAMTLELAGYLRRAKAAQDVLRVLATIPLSTPELQRVLGDRYAASTIAAACRSLRLVGLIRWSGQLNQVHHRCRPAKVWERPRR
jgi:hypothetical protein